MKMSEFQVCLFKYRKVLAILVAIALLACNFFINLTQSYTAEVCIKYLSSSAVDGLTENGSALNPYDVKNANVVKKALLDIGYTQTDYAEIIKGIVVEPVVPTAEEEKYASWIDQYDDYEKDETGKKFPVYYSIKFTTDKGNDFAREFLGALIKQYRTYYVENYAYTTDVRALSEDAVLEFDYFETALILQEKIESDIEYFASLGESEPSFRSVNTGYSMMDISAEYENLQKMYLAGTTQYILENGLSKNGEKLVTTLETRAENNLMESERNNAKADTEKGLMDIYSKKNKEYMWDTRYSSDEDGEQVRQDTERDRNHNMTKTTYDQIVANYVAYRVKADNFLVDSDYNEKHVDYFANGTMDSEIAKQKIEGICQKFNELNVIAEETIADYNSYKSARSIALVSGMTTYDSIGSVIYYTVSVILALGIGITGVLFVELKRKKAI